MTLVYRETSRNILEWKIVGGESSLPAVVITLFCIIVWSTVVVGTGAVQVVPIVNNS